MAALRGFVFVGAADFPRFCVDNVRDVIGFDEDGDQNLGHRLWVQVGSLGLHEVKHYPGQCGDL